MPPLSWSEPWFIHDETDESWTDMPLSAAEASTSMNEQYLMNLLNAGALSKESIRRITQVTWDNA